MHPLGYAALLSSAMTALALDVTLILPASRPNPLTLASSTHATLTSLGQRFAAPISDTSTFVFRNVTPGSYLADVHCPSDGFRPLRVDVGGGGEVHAWETYRGNDWDNKGEAISMIETDTVKGFELSALGGKTYFTERPKFSILSILMNPMILMGIVSMVFFVGMPKLVENMDPETRAEFEESQKNSAMNAFLSGGASKDNPLSNFDMAGYLAGTGKKSAAPAEAPAKNQGVKR